MKSADGRRVAAVALVQAIVLTWLSAHLATWQDEEFTLATTAHGVVYAAWRAVTYEDQAPLYFIVLAALRSLGSSVALAREFSIACAVATTFVAAALSRRLAPAVPPWLTSALIAASSFGLYSAVEIRTYAFGMLQCAALLLAFERGFRSGNDRRARVAFGLLALVGVYTDYFIAFDVAACVATLFALRRIRAGAVAAALAFVAAVLFVPLLVAVPGQSAGTFGTILNHPTLATILRPFDFVFPPLNQTFGFAGRIASLALFVIVAVSLIAARARPASTVVAYAVLCAFVFAQYSAAQAVLHVQFIPPRHFFAQFMPEWALFVSLASTATTRVAGVARRCVIAVACAVALAEIVNAFATYRSLAKVGDAAHVGAYLSDVTRPGDVVAVFFPEFVPALARTYRGDAKLEPFPEPLDPDHYDADQSAIRSVGQAERGFDRLSAYRRIWFVEVGDCKAGDAYGCQTLRSTMYARYDVVEVRNFYRSTVFELEPIADEAGRARPTNAGRNPRSHSR